MIPQARQRGQAISRTRIMGVIWGSEPARFAYESDPYRRRVQTFPASNSAKLLLCLSGSVAVAC